MLIAEPTVNALTEETRLHSSRNVDNPACPAGKVTCDPWTVHATVRPSTIRPSFSDLAAHSFAAHFMPTSAGTVPVEAPSP